LSIEPSLPPGRPGISLVDWLITPSSLEQWNFIIRRKEVKVLLKTGVDSFAGIEYEWNDSLCF